MNKMSKKEKEKQKKDGAWKKIPQVLRSSREGGQQDHLPLLHQPYGFDRSQPENYRLGKN